METADIPTTRKSSHTKITNEGVLITFLDITGTVHSEFIPQGQTVNHTYYVEILKCLLKAESRKGVNFGPTIGFSIMTMLQLTKRSQFLTHKSIPETEQLTLFPLFGSE
jgi:hypothetical protein